MRRTISEYSVSEDVLDLILTPEEKLARQKEMKIQREIEKITRMEDNQLPIPIETDPEDDFEDRYF